MEAFLSIFGEDFFYATIRMAAPILIAALGEIMLERAGIFNLGIEGGMLLGAFAGVLGSYWFHSALMGLLLAIVLGALLGLLFGWATISLRANQAVTGTGINILFVGLTSLLGRMIWGISDVPTTVEAFAVVPIPFLCKIPLLGHVLFEHTVLVYVAYLMVAVTAFVLYKTTWGLKIRAIGEYPKAADTMGIRVIGWKYAMSVFACVCAAVGGVILSLCFNNLFTDNMSSGRGYMAVACVILGQWNPVGALLGSLIFGAGNALQMRLQAYGVPIATDLLLVIPMALALLMVLLVRGKASARPASLAKPYEK